MKGKKVQEFAVAKSIPDEAVAAMLGPTGNLRAPTVVRGKTVLVGFNDEIFTKTLG
jgi:arsenate reductase-like glutaredoxin family protein